MSMTVRGDASPLMIEGLTAQASIETGFENDLGHGFAEFGGQRDCWGPSTSFVPEGGQGDLGCLFPGVFGP